MNVDFFTFISSYNLRKCDGKKRANSKILNSPPHLNVDTDGKVDDPCTFDFMETRHSAANPENVIMYNPHFNINEKDEKSAYALLLLHGTWGMEGEDGLLQHEGHTLTAVAKLAAIKESLPEYVRKAMSARHHHESILANTGVPDNGDHTMSPEVIAEMIEANEEHVDAPIHSDHNPDLVQERPGGNSLNMNMTPPAVRNYLASYVDDSIKKLIEYSNNTFKVSPTILSSDEYDTYININILTQTLNNIN
jgi:hypothetical protein